jgi:hypothetical protein
MRRPVVEYIHERTVVIAAYQGTTVRDHGTGLPFEMSGDLICATAGHVIAPYSVDSLQIIASPEASNVKNQPLLKKTLGNIRSSENDVGYIKLQSDFRARFPNKRYMTVDDLEVQPENLSSDVAIVCGAPEADHNEQRPNVHRFGTLTYFGRFTGGLDWTPPFGEVPLIEVPFKRQVEDGCRNITIDVPEACGMSGGGVWRAHFNRPGIWHTASMCVVGVNTEFHRGREIVLATRAFKLLSLLAEEYRPAAEKLNREISWTV